MYKFLSSRGQTLALVLGLVVIAIFLISVMTGLNGQGYDMSTDLNGLPDEAKAKIDFFNSGLILTVVLAAFGALAAVFFGIVGIFKFPKASMKAIVAIVVLLIGFFLFYSMSGTEFGAGTKMSELIQKYSLGDSTVKFIGGGINITILLALLSLVLMVVFEIKNAFN